MLNECPISSFKFSLKFFIMQMQLHLRSHSDKHNHKFHSKWEKEMVLHHALSNNFITIQAKKLKDSNVLLNKFYSPLSKDNFFFSYAGSFPISIYESVSVRQMEQLSFLLALQEDDKKDHFSLLSLGCLDV